MFRGDGALHSWLCTCIPRRWISSWLCTYSEGGEPIMPLHVFRGDGAHHASAHIYSGTFSEREELIKALLVNLSGTSAAKREMDVELWGGGLHINIFSRWRFFGVAANPCKHGGFKQQGWHLLVWHALDVGCICLWGVARGAMVSVCSIIRLECYMVAQLLCGLVARS